MTWSVIPGSGTGPVRAPGSSVEPKRDAQRRGSVRALVVDDEPSICKALQWALTSAGYDVVTARSGEAAFAIIETEVIDVMLVDLRIPDMRGDTIFEYAAGVHPHLRYSTLFVTGDISDQALDLIRACKCNYVRKPFDLNVLLNAVAAVSPLSEIEAKSSA